MDTPVTMDDGYQFTLLIYEAAGVTTLKSVSSSRSDPAFSRVSADTTLEQSPKPTRSQRVEVLAYAKVKDR